MRFPSIRTVAAVLRDINANVENECDVRLCVWFDGKWCIRSGDVQYDQSHSDYCGSSCVPGVVGGRVTRFKSEDIARDLLQQCKDCYSEGQS
jgi:hypothetical protein